MESGSIQGYLHNKTILITGATGFLGMVFVEKILRVQPDLKKLYILLRASNTKSATERMHDEILGKELFRILREKHGADFESFIAQKVVALPGDVSYENLGVNDQVVLLEDLYKEVQVIVNSAANTNFDERYDISLNINVFGVLNMLRFAHKCSKLEMLLHISTAYVCGERDGLIPESLFLTNEMSKELTNFDFEVVECNLMKEKLNELKRQDAPEEIITKTMKDFGIERAQLNGWPNTYAFTKAMGEVLLSRRSKKNLPFVILRPSIVTSTYNEPFSGWTQGYRTVDSLIGGYCKGKLKYLPMGNVVLDMIPVDMVVNAMIIAIVVNANKSSGFIYHVGSSLKNPVSTYDVYGFIIQYFSKNPFVDRHGKPVIVKEHTTFNTVAKFHMYMKIRYMLPLKGLEFVNRVSGQIFQNSYVEYNRKLKLAMRLAELYGPYLFFKGIFDDSNTEELRRTTRERFIEEADCFNFDPRCIDWEDYFMHTHIPGLLRHVIIK